MKALKKLSGILGIVFAMALVNSAFAQEYDDMYFNAKDRKVVQAKELEKDDSRATYQSYTNNTYTDNYSAQEVNPDYIARYKTNSDYAENSQYVDNGDGNVTYSEPSYSNISYFPEEQAALAQGGTGTTVVNNYYNNANPFRGNTFYDPFMGFNSGFGYSPWGWNSGWNVSVGFGWGTRMGFGYNDPFWGYPGYAGGWYDPWNNWGSPYYNTWGYGWNRWDRFGYAYNAGFNNGLYCGYNTYRNSYNYGDVTSNSSRDIIYGGGRSSRYVADNARLNSRNARASSGISSRGSANTVSSSESRNYTRTQNEYFSRSRTGLSSSNSRSSGAISSRSRATSSAYSPSGRTTGNSSYGTSSRTAASSSSNRATSYSSRSTYNAANSGTLRSNSGSSSSRRYNSSSANTSGSRYSGGSTYQRSSGSSGSSRSYSTPSRSSSSSYTPSRSSGSSSRSYSAPSRSSGSRSSGSSYTPSRSSGSSSGSRSSGGSRSGGSRRGGGL